MSTGEVSALSPTTVDAGVGLSSVSALREEPATRMVNKLAVERFHAAFSQYLDAGSAESILYSIFLQQARMLKGESIYQNANENFPFKTLITKRSITVIKEQWGEGSTSKVFKSIIFTKEDLNNESSSEPERLAVKLSRTPYTPEKRKIAQIAKFSSPSTTKTIDVPLATGRTPQGICFSLHEFCDSILLGLNYCELEQPVGQALSSLIDVAKAISAIHKEGYVHRDIKAGNILINKEGGTKVTDFGALTPKKKNKHKTIATEIYLDPSMFGNSPGELLIYQKKREGIQTPEGDVFALGRTVEKDVLMLLILQFARAKGLNLDIQSLNPKTIEGPFTDEELTTYGEQYPYRAIYFSRSRRVQERLSVFESVSARRKTMEKCLDQLDLSSIQLKALKELATLAYDMQEQKGRPNIQEVLERLKTMIEPLNFSPSFIDFKKPPEYPSSENKSTTITKTSVYSSSYITPSQQILGFQPKRRRLD